MKKDSPLLLATEWVDLPLFIFYHFGWLLFLNFGFGWKVFLSVWLVFWLARFLWSRYLLKTGYFNLPALIFLRDTLNGSNIIIVIVFVLVIYLKLYAMAGFLALWKILFCRAFQFAAPIEKPAVDDYVYKFVESMKNE